MTTRRQQRAAVLGCNGQDGSHLVEHLLRRGYEVAGLSRQPRYRYRVESKSFQYRPVDLRKPQRFAAALEDVDPDVTFHMAAVHGEAGSRYETVWQDMLAVNVGATHVCLEHLRKRKGASLIYAGSCKVFGPDYPRRVSEKSEHHAKCLYSVSKLAAQNLIECYRRDHGLKASVVHFFNHESERRPSTFFVPALVSALRRSINDRRFQTRINTLQFYCDWGSASEYMDIAIDLSERAPGQDVIMATGIVWKAATLAEQLFKRHGLDYRQHLIEHGRGDSNRRYVVSTDRLRRLVGRVPQVGALDLCEQMLVALASDR